MTAIAENVITAQPGQQEKFLSCDADIAIYGGAAGGGKSYALLLDPLRWAGVKGFGGTIFRRTFPMLKSPGGLWDVSQELYAACSGVPREGDYTWTFPSGSRITFSHMQREKDRFNWQGAQLAFIGYDELTQFTRRQFFYLLSRLRTTCGIMPYVRATCNPDPDSWVLKDLIEWYLDDSGYVHPDRANVVRWMARDGEELVWADDPDYLRRKGLDPLSFCFIPASLEDNPILMDTNPHYQAELMALPSWERAALRYGNWYARPAAGLVFKREWFEVVDAIPAGTRSVRYWDRASSEPSESYPNPDWTAGVKMEEKDGMYYVTDVSRFRGRPARVRLNIKAMATQDGDGTKIGLEQDPGQAGVSEVEDVIRFLAGYDARAFKVSQDKITRAGPLSAQAEIGNVKMLRGKWNDTFLDELEAFPPENEEAHDDQVDAASGAFNFLCNREPEPNIR